MNQVQNLDEAVCISLHANALGKGMNLSILMPWGDNRAVSALNFDKATSSGKG